MVGLAVGSGRAALPAGSGSRRTPSPSSARSWPALAALLLGLGWLSLGGWVFLAAGSLDFVDGRVARATGRASRAGAFLDSTLDRVGELLVFGGLAVTFRDSPALLAALAAAGASLLVSYARARGEALGAGEAAKVGGMQRPERVVVTGVACALSPLADAAFGAGPAAPRWGARWPGWRRSRLAPRRGGAGRSTRTLRVRRAGGGAAALPPGGRVPARRDPSAKGGQIVPAVAIAAPQVAW